MRITWSTDVDAPGCPGEILAEDGRSLLVQSEWDYPSTACMFGWDMTEVRPKVQIAPFNRFTIELPAEAVSDCSHSGECTADVQAWLPDIARLPECTPEALRAELREYGAWDDDQLDDDAANWERMVWIAACDASENPCAHDGTDGTVDCPECGCTASEFISAAYEYLIENHGATVDDPGYFEEYTSGGAYLCDCTDGYRRGVVYAKPDTHHTAGCRSAREPNAACPGVVTDWHGNIIARATLGPIYRGGFGARMRSVRFTLDGVTYTGRYGCDWAQMVRVKSTKKVVAA